MDASSEIAMPLDSDVILDGRVCAEDLCSLENLRPLSFSAVIKSLDFQTVSITGKFDCA